MQVRDGSAGWEEDLEHLEEGEDGHGLARLCLLQQLPVQVLRVQRDVVPRLQVLKVGVAEDLVFVAERAEVRARVAVFRGLPNGLEERPSAPGHGEPLQHKLNCDVVLALPVQLLLQVLSVHIPRGGVRTGEVSRSEEVSLYGISYRSSVIRSPEVPKDLLEQRHVVFVLLHEGDHLGGSHCQRV